MTTEQAAKKWDLTIARVLQLCPRILGATRIKKGRRMIWDIPNNATKPENQKAGPKVKTAGHVHATENK